MPDEDLRESSRLMFRRLRLDADDETRERYAGAVAEMSKGWPQHLFGAQYALAEQLKATDGDLGQADLGYVEAQSTKARERYYAGRLSSEPLLENVEFTARVVKSATDGYASARVAKRTIYNVCLETLRRGDDVPLSVRAEIERESLPATSEKLANALIERGVFAQLDDGGYEMAVPAMADWLESQSRARELARRRTPTKGGMSS